MNTQKGDSQIAANAQPRSRDWTILQSLVLTPLFVFIVDLAIGGAAYVLAWMIRMDVALPFTQDLLPQERWGVVEHYWILLVGTQGFFLFIFGLYDDLRLLRYREVVAHVSMSCFFQVLALTSAFFLTNEVFPRTVILLFGILNLLFLCGWRVSAKRALQSAIRRVLVVGEDGAPAIEIVEEIKRSPWMGLRVVGLALSSDALARESSLEVPILGGLDDTREIVERMGIDEIVIASGNSWKDRVLDSLGSLQVEKSLLIAIRPSVYEIAIGRLRHLNIHDTPLIEVRRNPREPFQRFLKRSFDLLFSLVCLVLAAPLFLVVAPLVVAGSRGPVFYLQERVGLGSRIFKLIKFRTMIQDAERQTGETLASENDPRITAVGAWLRRFRLDEIPQLINVLKGDMSFVGPRPERPGFVKKFAERLPGYNERHRVKPGITGLAQVRGYYHTAAENKLKYDLAYIYNYSFSVDLVILLETLKVVLIRRGS
jgi:exopolysaccharide biosynthesis polyprenyl glycosylphosphotransferase